MVSTARSAVPEMSNLIDDVRGLMLDALTTIGPSERPAVETALARLDEPLRIAVAGKIKAGKSTLLNALIGDELAPTDAGECTKVVTWYEDGHRYAVHADLPTGEKRELAFSRVDGAVQPNLGQLQADDIARLTVTWPAAPLRSTTLIDTPGIDSISVEVSARSHTFLTPGAERATDADAVLYLVRHLHANDVRFLESFHDDGVSQGTPTNAIGILSRADEIGDCELDALQVAEQAAAEYREDPKLRALCQTVVPVAGLLAQAGATLLQSQFDDLVRITNSGPDHLDELLASAERFVHWPSAVSTEVREQLIDRFGLFGVRLAVEAIASARVRTATELATEFVDVSGITALRDLLARRFGSRTQALKARSALAVLRRSLEQRPADPEHQALLRRIDHIQFHAHEFREIVLLSRLRSGAVAADASSRRLLTAPVVHEIERLLGGDGTSPSQRLGLPADVDPAEINRVAHDAHHRLSALSSHPLMTGDARSVVTGTIRSIEGILSPERDHS